MQGGSGVTLFDASAYHLDAGVGVNLKGIGPAGDAKGTDFRGNAVTFDLRKQF